jgi:3-phenylpropionate/trans-cinnamate dioxygenase ferredoxin reductase subunit
MRRAGFAGEIVLVGHERHPPYQRPPLSKRYLLGEVPPHHLPLPALDASLRLGEDVTEIDPGRHEIRLAGRDRLAYERLLLATGSRPRVLSPSPLAGEGPRRGGEGGGRILYLRELEDADRLREVLRSSVTLDIVGAGFIGCEVAAVGRTLGLQVTVYEALEHPLQRVLGPEVGRWLGDVHRRHGVDLRTGVRELPAFEGWVLAAVGT